MNKEKRKQYEHEYYLKNKDKILERTRINTRKRYNTDNKFKVACNLRRRLAESLKTKKWQKNSHFAEYIGCSKDELIKYLESKFKEGMTWDNYSQKGWHIDHIIPLSSAKTEEELYKLSHYTNLQPLWAEENKRKWKKHSSKEQK